MRQPFFDVYAFCRTADDLADESASKEEARQGLADYREQVKKIFDGKFDGKFDGEPATGIFIALAQTVDQFDLPRQPFDQLLDAFEQDQEVDRYEDEPQLLDYCSRSANPVGRLVLAMADCRDQESIRLSDQVCTALQLANFWQDVARDSQMGRVYLPKSVMDRHGFHENLIDQTIAAQASTPTVVREAIAELCQQTRSRFEEGHALTQRVPSWLAADVDLFVRGGLATLDAIEKIDFDVLRTRPTVGKAQQAWLTLRVLIGNSVPWLKSPVVSGNRGNAS